MIVTFFRPGNLHDVKAPVVELSVDYLRYDPLNGMVVLNSAIKFPVTDLIDVRTTNATLGEKKL